MFILIYKQFRIHCSYIAVVLNKILTKTSLVNILTGLFDYQIHCKCDTCFPFNQINRVLPPERFALLVYPSRLGQRKAIYITEH